MLQVSLCPHFGMEFPAGCLEHLWAGSAVQLLRKGEGDPSGPGEVTVRHCRQDQGHESVLAGTWEWEFTIPLLNTYTVNVGESHAVRTASFLAQFAYRGQGRIAVTFEGGWHPTAMVNAMKDGVTGIVELAGLGASMATAPSSPGFALGCKSFWRLLIEEESTGATVAAIHHAGLLQSPKGCSSTSSKQGPYNLSVFAAGSGQSEPPQLGLELSFSRRPDEGQPLLGLICALVRVVRAVEQGLREDVAVRRRRGAPPVSEYKMASWSLEVLAISRRPQTERLLVLRLEQGGEQVHVARLEENGEAAGNGSKVALSDFTDEFVRQEDREWLRA